MKTKSFRIYTGDPNEKHFVEVSETPDHLHIKLSVSGGVIYLDHDAWEELTGMRYELRCWQPGNETSQVPPLDEDRGDMKVVLETADATINKLRKELDGNE